MKTKDIVNISLFTTLLAVCAWICIPTAVPFTLQTFAIFLAMLVLGGKRGIIVICIYLFLGAIGIPVFSAGTTGIGVIFGNTGGYMIGWIFIGLIMWWIDFLMKKKSSVKKVLQIIGLLIGLMGCYIIGTVWFVYFYSGQLGAAEIVSAFSVCVVPFIIPDLVKMFLAFVVSKRIRKIVQNV